MKYLKEYAKFKDVAISKNPDINNILDLPFQEDESLISNIYLDVGKNIELSWNDKYYHPIIDRLKDRTSFNSISDFNDVVEYGFNQIFPKQIGETIDFGGRYALHFNNHNFYLIISLNYENLFDDDTKIFIITLSTTTPHDDPIIEIYGD